MNVSVGKLLMLQFSLKLNLQTFGLSQYKICPQCGRYSVIEWPNPSEHILVLWMYFNTA